MNDQWIIRYAGNGQSNIDFEIGNIKFETIDKEKNTSFFIDGYILPRQSTRKFQDTRGLLSYLLDTYDEDFINHIKGVFILVLKKEKKISIYTDQFGLKKCFYRRYKQEVLISNNYFLLHSKYPTTINKVGIALYLLFEHFVCGHTYFEEIKYTQYATKMLLLNGICEIEQYWNPSVIIGQHVSAKITMSDFPDFWKILLSDYNSVLSSKEIAITMTGGNDSRMILAGLLANNLTPSLFSFGNPASNDGVIANLLSERTALKYSNYYIDAPTKDWFINSAKNIIRLGNPLINIHRAHRLNAIESLVESNNSVNTVYAGFMGGDFTKGIIYDDYITSRFYRLINRENQRLDNSIRTILDFHFFIYENDLIDNLVEIIKQQSWHKENDPRFREFLYVFEVVGSLHDYQDISLFQTKIEYSVNPFMDIDFLEALIGSGFSMLGKNNAEDKYFKRLDYSKLHVFVTNSLAPQLSDIPYAKKGYYTANEFLSNKVILALKRGYRYSFGPKYPQNFPYGTWIKDALRSLAETTKSQTIAELFVLSEYINILNDSPVVSTEGYWHRFSNLSNILLQTS